MRPHSVRLPGHADSTQGRVRAHDGVEHDASIRPIGRRKRRGSASSVLASAAGAGEGPAARLVSFGRVSAPDLPDRLLAYATRAAAHVKVAGSIDPTGRRRCGGMLEAACAWRCTSTRGPTRTVGARRRPRSRCRRRAAGGGVRAAGARILSGASAARGRRRGLRHAGRRPSRRCSASTGPTTPRATPYWTSRCA